MGAGTRAWLFVPKNTHFRVKLMPRSVNLKISYKRTLPMFSNAGSDTRTVG